MERNKIKSPAGCGAFLFGDKLQIHPEQPIFPPKTDLKSYRETVRQF